jgi:aminoglycoside 6'-N-acetyltransferase I
MSSRYGMEVRAANAGDAPGLVELLATAGLVLDAQAIAQRLAAVRKADGAALIATQWGPPSGLVILHWYSTIDEAGPTAVISTLLVGPDDRRRGVGRLLLKFAAQAARSAGCFKLALSTATDDPSLSGFCRATGFVEAGPRFVRSLRKHA